MAKIGIRNAKIVNEGKIVDGDVLIAGDRIERVGSFSAKTDADYEFNGDYLLPGIIDDQVHFRQPGMEWKADIASESRAALAGGVTSFMEMPNTKPPAITQELLQKKYDIAANTSFVNYSFYMGVSNDNLEEVLKTDSTRVCGLKIFMGSSTGNMLVDDMDQLEKVFSQSGMLIATHCENESTVVKNTEFFKSIYGNEIPFALHPDIRSREACYLSSSQAVELARKHGTRLHILHITTADELLLFDSDIPLRDKKITSEVCVHHLSFNSDDYERLGGLIKCNPAIKRKRDQQKLLEGLVSGALDVIATDHAPHTWEEKDNPYTLCPSGLPLIQHTLVGAVELVLEGKLNVKGDVSALAFLVDKMCHSVAECFNVKDRGYIREGYKADLVQLTTKESWKVEKENILYKCGWSPFENKIFNSKVIKTFVNGKLCFENGTFHSPLFGERLLFNN